VRRTAASAALAGSAGAAALCALVLHLNPEVPFAREVPALLTSLFVPWAAGLTLLLGLAAAAGHAARWWPRPAPPVVPRRPYFVVLSCLTLSAVAVVYWQNLLAYGSAIPVASVRGLAAAALAVTVAAVVLFAVGLDAMLFPRHGRPAAAPVAILACGLAVAVPLALRPPPAAPPSPVRVKLDAERPSRRVVVVGIDGLSPSDVVARDPAAARVPALARLARRGATATLATVRPTEGPPVWTTLMTGRLPRDHGIRSASTYRLLLSSTEWPLMPRGVAIGLLERVRLAARLPVTSGARRRRALWNVLDAFGAPSGLVRVWGTHPPETVKGFVLSPFFHATRRDPARSAGTLHPSDLVDEVRARAVSAADVDPALLRELASPAEKSDAPLADPRVRRLAEESLAPDLTYERAADVLRQAYDPTLLVVTLHGYDLAGHAFFRYAHPEAFGNVSLDDQRRYGRVLAGYAGFLARWVSEIDRGRRPGDVLLVVSGHGLEPTPLWRRLFAVLTGAETDAASHAGAPPGVLLAVGDGIQPGATVPGASVVDVAPTILYLLGLPVARDMEGRVLAEMFTPGFADENPVTYIPSYESLAVAPAAPAVPVESLPPLPEERP
jgi:predicted AlkP superfamily phosphohydrolase/phosphomutase